MTNTQRTVRIFISSPGDVADERENARRVIEGLQKRYPDAVLQPVLWEDLALPLTASFQETIELILHKQPIDIAVFILWSRLGSPLTNRVVRPDGTEYRSGTEREFDLMLEAFRQSGQKRPLMLAYTRDNLEGFQEKLKQTPLDKIQELLDQRKMAEAFIREQFHDAEGRNLRAYHTYREPVDFVGRLRVHLQQALESLLGTDATARWNEAPYRGLEVFDVRHADIFRGRDDEICDLLQRLRDQRRTGCAFAVIVGASGAGKSSLARAGIAASLLQHSDDDGVKVWRTEFFVPALETSDLLTRLTRALFNALPELRSSATALEDVRSLCLQDAALAMRLSIAPAFFRAAEQAQGVVRLLLVIDQMEELWTDRRITKEDREQFFAVIEALAGSGHVMVLATLRSDFYSHAQQLEAFLRLKGERGHFDLLPPNAAALQRLITEPARLAGVRFERHEQTNRSLDELILQDAAKDPSALPLLQYALSELYQNRDDAQRLLTFAAYQAMGGVEGALGKRAEEVFQGLPDEAQTALNEVLPLLITLDIAGDQAAVRLRAPMHKLTDTAASAALTKALIDARFLTSDRQGHDAIVTLAHEALLRRWERIASWITSNREHLRLRARVEQSQHHWVSKDRHISLLLPSGLPLEEGQVLLREARSLLLAETTDYIERSIAHRQAESRRQRIIRTTAMTMSLAAALIAILGALWVNAERNAAVRATNAAVAAKNEETKAKDAERAQLKRAQDSERSAITAQQAEAKGRDLAERQQAEANRQNADHYWRLAVSHRGSLNGDEIVASHFFLRGADSLSLIPSALMKVADLGFLRSTTQAARVIDRRIMRSWTHDIVLKGALLSRDQSRLLMWGQDAPSNVLYGPGKAILWDVSKSIPQQIFNHPRSVLGAKFSDDESHVVTWSFDGTVRLWDVTQSEPLQIFTHEGEGPLFGVQISRDKSRVLTWGPGKDARLWDVTKTQSFDVFQHGNAVWNARFSDDESRVLTCSRDSTARLWEVGKVAPLNSFQHSFETVRGAIWNGCETRILTWGNDGTVRLWDAKNAEPLKTFKHGGAVLEASFSRDESRVLSRSDDTASLWSLVHDEPPVVFKHDGEDSEKLAGAALSPNETRVLTWSGDLKSGSGEARLWDVSKETRPRVLKHGTKVRGAKFSPDGANLLTWSDDNIARLWTEKATEPIQTFAYHSTSPGPQFSQDGSHLLMSNDEGTARLWDIKHAAPLGTLPHVEALRGARFTHDDTRVLTWTLDGDATSWDMASPTASEKWKHEKHYAKGAQIGHHSQHVLTWGFTYQAHLWEVTNPKPLQTFHHDSPMIGARFSRGESRVLTWSADKTAKLWDTMKVEPIWTFKHGSVVTDAQFNHDESRVLTVCGDRSVRLWDVASGGLLQVFKHECLITGMQFSHDGKRIITWSNTPETSISKVYLWDVSSSVPIHFFEHGKFAPINGAQFSRDDSRVISWSDDFTMRLWDAATAKLLQVYKHSNCVKGARFSQDDSRILTWCGLQHRSPNEVRLWDVTQPEPIQIYKHDDVVIAAEFSGDEHRVLSWSGGTRRRSTVRLWDVSKSEPIQSLQLDTVITDAQFNRDESRLLIRDEFTAWLWDIRDPLAMLTAAERILELEVRSATTLDANLKLRTLSFAEWQAKVKSPEYRAIEKKIAAQPQTSRRTKPDAAPHEASCE